MCPADLLAMQRFALTRSGAVRTLLGVGALCAALIPGASVLQTSSPAPASGSPTSMSMSMSILGTGAPTARPHALTARMGAASSYALFAADGGPVRWNPCSAVHYRVNPAGAPFANPVGTVRTAMAKVSAATGMRFVLDGTTSYVPTDPGMPGAPAPIVVAWSSGGSGLLHGGAELGVGGWTSTSGFRSTTGRPLMEIQHGFVVLDGRAERTFARPGFGAGATEGALLLHELGHAIGLNHTYDKTQIMYPVLLPSGGVAAYGRGDLAGLWRQGKGGGCVAPIGG